METEQCNYTVVSNCLFICNLKENYRVLFSLKDEIYDSLKEKEMCFHLLPIGRKN